MKRFLITYTHRPETGWTEEDWHRQVRAFIAALDDDPALRGRIVYRCMKAKDAKDEKTGAAYYHLAEAADDGAIQELQQRAFFQRYTEETKRVAGGVVQVTALETIAETKPAA